MDKKNGTTPKSSTESNTHSDSTASQPGGATPIQLASYAEIFGDRVVSIRDDAQDMAIHMCKQFTNNPNALKQLTNSVTRGIAELSLGKILEIQLSLGIAVIGFFRRPVDGEHYQYGVLKLRIDSSEQLIDAYTTPDDNHVIGLRKAFDKAWGPHGS